MPDVPDDPDLLPFDPHHPRIDRGTGGPIVTEDQDACFFDGRFYPPGSIEMIEGRAVTCRGGNWIGEGDDPPFRPRRGEFPNGLEPDA
ncbi:hypothetical protein [Glacieibacterium sp.]|uniref:hypothetical protein n=1 Tax=Glacieibacterium sp. TaxID=2860237 RepID=UPI003B0032D1